MRIKAPRFSDQNLGQEAAQIVNEAAAPIEEWIEQGLDEIGKNLKADAQAAADALEEQFDVLEKEYDTMAKSYEGHIKSLELLKNQIVELDTKNLGNEIQNLVDAMKAEREMLNVKYRNIGKLAVKAGKSIISKVI